MTIFWDQTGPLVQYRNGVLLIADLNPETEIRWRVTRAGMFKLGLRAIAAGLFARK
jgi:hypothetical protein